MHNTQQNIKNADVMDFLSKASELVYLCPNLTKSIDDGLFDFSTVLSEANSSTVVNLLRKMYYTNKFLFFHCLRTALYTGVISNHMGISANILFIGAILHDVGKMFIPDKVLNKKAPLTDDEFDLIKQHTIYGVYCLLNDDITNDTVYASVKYHHKFFNGHGYPIGTPPDGLLPLVHIITACDAFDAMTSRRAYGKTKTPEEALSELRLHSGEQFDPNVVDSIASIFEEFQRTALPLIRTGLSLI